MPYEEIFTDCSEIRKNPFCRKDVKSLNVKSKKKSRCRGKYCDLCPFFGNLILADRYFTNLTPVAISFISILHSDTEAKKTNSINIFGK
jgi:hypothetical protein